jgi:hypothetical protein
MPALLPGRADAASRAPLPAAAVVPSPPICMETASATVECVQGAAEGEDAPSTPSVDIVAAHAANVVMPPSARPGSPLESASDSEAEPPTPAPGPLADPIPPTDSRRLKRTRGSIVVAGLSMKGPVPSALPQAPGDAAPAASQVSLRTQKRHARRDRAAAKRRKNEPNAARDPRTYVLAPHVLAHHPGAAVKGLDVDSEQAINAGSTGWESVPLRYRKPDGPLRAEVWGAKPTLAQTKVTWTKDMVLAAGCRLIKWDGVCVVPTHTASRC